MHGVCVIDNHQPILFVTFEKRNPNISKPFCEGKSPVTFMTRSEQGFDFQKHSSMYWLCISNVPIWFAKRNYNDLLPSFSSVYSNHSNINLCTPSGDKSPLLYAYYASFINEKMSITDPVHTSLISVGSHFSTKHVIFDSLSCCFLPITPDIHQFHLQLSNESIISTTSIFKKSHVKEYYNK